MPNPLPTIRTYSVLFGDEGVFSSTDKQAILDHISARLDTSLVGQPLVVLLDHIEVVD